MPHVDFTLEDIAKQTKSIVDEAIGHALVKERKHTQSLIDSSIVKALVAEREYNRTMMREVAHEVSYEVSYEVAQNVVTRELSSFWESNLEPAFESLHGEIRDVKEHVGRLGLIVDQHSKDIMELRARLA